MPSYTFTENTTAQNTSDTPTTGVTEDNRLLEVSPTSNFGSDSNLAVAKFAAGDHQTTVLRFDTSSIGSGETVTSANLYVYQNFYGGSGTTRSLAFSDVLQTSWTEAGSNWNTYDGTNSWNTGGAQGAGTDIASTPFLQTTIGNTTGVYYSFSISTSIISTSGNTEIHVYLDETGDAGEITVWTSSEGTNGQRPELEVITTTAASLPSQVTLLGAG